MYNISDYSYKQAEKLGVDIKPSTRKGKKIDVFKKGDKVASIGDINSSDYPSYIKTKGKQYADERRRLFKARFKKSSSIKDTPSYFTNRILW